MKPEVIASHRTLFGVLVACFVLLQAASVVVLWFVDPRQGSPWCETAGVTGLSSFVGLLFLWWLLQRDAPRLASVCLWSAVAGMLCSMILPAVP